MVTLFYFSGTGNTRAVCEEFIRLSGGAEKATLTSIDRFFLADPEAIAIKIRNSTMVGFAYPIYGANLPPLFDAFLTSLEGHPFASMPCFVISTVAYINAYGPFLAAKRLRTINLDLRWHAIIRCPDSTKVHPRGRANEAEIAARASPRLEKLVARISNGRAAWEGIGPWLVGGYAVRKLSRKPLKNYHKSLCVDENACVLCMACMENCPTAAISYDKGSGFSFGEGCTSCFRCRTRCPANAIMERKREGNRPRHEGMIRSRLR
jgi:NAD-dependent dihydropyrimidine dehydrogenase PreA subunit